MEDIFKGIKKLGMGCMRFPFLSKTEVDLETVKKMIDRFLEHGFSYFDMANGYLRENDRLIRKILTERYPRGSFFLANKLSKGLYETEEDIRPYFENQLDYCGVEYFDFYLVHSVKEGSYRKYTRTNAFKVLSHLKDEGKIQHLGISFHDSADFLKQVLLEHPEIEFVQLQINYLDWEDDIIQSKRCYEVCVEFEKPVIVMEPVKGGILNSLPEEISSTLDSLDRKRSRASYAFRFVNSLPYVKIVLSGMSNIEQVEDNIFTFEEDKPLDEKENQILSWIREFFHSRQKFPCTKCNYCVGVCPRNIPIPSIISYVNSDRLNYQDRLQALSCIHCKKCEEACPQHIHIEKILREISETRIKDLYESFFSC